MNGPGRVRDRVVVAGDLINDVVVVPRGPIRDDTDTASSIRSRAGGSAANTAAWLGSLGVPVDFVGAVGTADAAEHERELRELGVEPHLQLEPGVPTGTIVIIVEGERRTMLTERGANALLAAERITDGLLASAWALHLSAYSFAGGFGMPGGRELIDRAQAADVAVLVNPGSRGWIDDLGGSRVLDAVRGCDVLLPSLAEGVALTGESDPERIVDALLEIAGTVVVTLGADGVIARRRGGALVSVPALRTRSVDPTGAGDAFTAGFLTRWRPDAPDELLRDALGAGVRIAARAVMVIGGRPAL